jgi:hypothetical protein
MSERSDHDEQAHAEWVAVATFATGLEADMARQQLDAEGIPVLTKSDAPGIFGAGFQGSVGGGVTLHVPSPEVDRAMMLLDMQP